MGNINITGKIINTAMIALISVILAINSSCSGNDDDLSTREIKIELNDSNYYLKSAITDDVYYPILITDSTIHINVKKEDDLKRLIPVFPNDIEAKMNGEKIVPGISQLDYSDFCNPVTLTFTSPTGNTKHVKYIIYDLPVVMITTPDGNPIISRDERVDSCIVTLVEGGVKIDLPVADIKSRGGSTWQFWKKPYNIKFREKTSILGMPKHKKWILLANAFYDRTQLHNDVAFEIARLTDYPWVMKGDFVEVILNGAHQGLYYLCEKIEIDKNRINIRKIKETDLEGENLTGGYLLEMNEEPYGMPNTFATDFFNTTGYNFNYKLGWEIKDPDDEIPLVQQEYIRNAMNYMESLMWYDDSLKTGKWMNYLDIESAVNLWLVEDLAGNEEASRSKNIYMYKDIGDQKFRFGPPWDFDAGAFGVDKVFYCNNTTVYYRQLFKDSVFRKRVKEKWNGYYPIWKHKIPEFIEKRYAQISRSALRNETFIWTKWYERYEYPQKTYREIVERMKVIFNERLEWMNEQVNNLEN